MKSKFTTYLLIAAVIVLWGIIIKKVFFSKPTAAPVQRTETRTAAKEDEAPTLALDYRDPFRPAPRPRIVEKTASKPSKPAEPPRINMKFIGRLECGGVRNYIVELDGKQYTFSLNEESDGFRLVRVFPDSLQFSFNKNLYTLSIE